MRGDVFILQVCDFLDDGDGHYRLHEPLRQLGQLPGVLAVDCHFLHRFLPDLLRAADVVILPFIHDWDFFPLIERRRGDGRATVFEANDFFSAVQEWNPIAPQWLDRAVQGEYRHYMAQCDAVQTSTPELARRWRPWARQVAVFPNQLTDLPPLGPPPERPLTVGWGGSPGHFADWYHVAPWLEKWLLAHPQVHLAVMTHEFARPFLRLPPERYHFTPFGSLPKYLRFLPALDVGLAPLLPTDYNRCRSDVKFLEYAAHGVAGVYADLEPYRSSVAHGRTGLLYQTEAELLRHLDALAADPALRRRLRAEAYQWVASRRRGADHAGERLAFYRGLLPGPPRGLELPAEVAAAGVTQGNYLQLRPGEPEQALKKALDGQGKRESAAELGELLGRHPDYYFALYHRGRLLNDLRAGGEALPYLERARALNPDSAAVLCEVGRSLYALQDAAGGRQALEAALRLNPCYYPGWQSLLRLLQLQGAADGDEWLRRARRLYPESFALAVAGAALYRGADAVAYLRQALDEFAPTLAPAERPGAALAFGRAIEDAVADLPAGLEVLDLLRRACAVFPPSARLAAALGAALRRAGRDDEARAELCRALALRRAASVYRREFPDEHGTLHFWQFAEHTRRALGAFDEPGYPLP